MQLFITRSDRPPFTGEFEGPVELGRQDQAAGDPPPIACRALEERTRVIVVPADKVDVSKRQLLLEPLDSNRVRATNVSQVRGIRLHDGSELAMGQTRELTLPKSLTLGDALVRIEPALLTGSSSTDYQRLGGMSLMPGTIALTGTSAAPALTALNALDVASLSNWLQTLAAVLQSAASSTEFFQQAARAVVELVGLDSGAVLLFQERSTDMQACWSRQSGADLGDWAPSDRILNRLRQEKQTLWNNPQSGPQVDGSLMHVQAVVAAPILNSSGQVIGALYGDRRSFGGFLEIKTTEAMLVQALAAGVAAGLARVEQEKAAVAAQVRFEQFFSPELSRQLAIEPDMLRGRDAEVTILFCDIRSFSSVAHRIGPALTFDWINSVMSALSDCVARHDGVLVDFIGDELIGMWGAPCEQKEHAQLACRAGQDMLRCVAEINAQWQAAIGAPTNIGIGINSGIARVGNTGSHRRFKYGPLGNTVNLGSRVQGATKFLQVGLLITQATRDRLDATFAPRRLCQVQVVNIDEPVTLYELPAAINDGWLPLCKQYEEALAHFERRELQPALTTLSSLLSQLPDDGPARALLVRTLQAMVQDENRFQSVWELAGK